MTYEMQVWDASRKLWRHALKLTRNDVAAAEDIMSEAVLNALTVKTRPDNIQSWLYGALRNRYVDGKRKDNGRTMSAEGPRLIFTDKLYDLRQDICTPEAILIAKQGLPQMQPRAGGKGKLTDDDVLYIRRTKRTAKYLRARFKVHHYTIAGIRNGTLYSHVTECAT